MKKEMKTLWIVVAVLAVLQIIGGSVYTAMTAIRERDFTYVDCTIVSVQTTQEGDTVQVNGVTVTYTDAAGKTVTAEMLDFPERFSVGQTFRGRYENDPRKISAEKTDWFTPVFLIVLGAAYGLFDVAALLLRKKMGLYALADISENPSPEEEE